MFSKILIYPLVYLLFCIKSTSAFAKYMHIVEHFFHDAQYLHSIDFAFAYFII